MQRYQEAEEALKKAFKLDSEDQELEELLQQVMIINRSQKL
jgi:hypothetical protein